MKESILTTCNFLKKNVIWYGQLYTKFYGTRAKPNYLPCAIVVSAFKKKLLPARWKKLHNLQYLSSLPNRFQIKNSHFYLSFTSFFWSTHTASSSLSVFIALFYHFVLYVLFRSSISNKMMLLKVCNGL
jgi:hypothetical protein